MKPEQCPKCASWMSLDEFEWYCDSCDYVKPIQTVERYKDDD